MNEDLIRLKSHGLVGPGELFHIDAWSRAPINLVTHGHSDHARAGSDEYWCTPDTAKIIRYRIGAAIKIRIFAYGEKVKLGDIWISFHPAGHILGSAQIRVESRGQVWVVSGDYKRDFDPTCVPFEVVPCDTLITEATFGLPIYNWAPMTETAREIYEWWNWCKREKVAALLFAYSLGKSQRILAELANYTDEEVLVHGSVENLTGFYREAGIRMLPTRRVREASEAKEDFAGRLVIAPPSAHRSGWMKKFPAVSTGFCSGWMAVRGIRRRRGYERGFVVSDHADWKGLVRTVQESQAQRVLVTHGNTETLARFLSETQGVRAEALRTPYGDEESQAAGPEIEVDPGKTNYA
jgi:putative mRNA 3-end processing factor